MSNFWKNKKVLITGASGFIGKNLTKSFEKEKTKVVALIRNKQKLKFKSRNIIVKKVRELTFKNLNKLIKKHDIDTIFHLAANNDNISLDFPLDIFDSNIKASYNLLETCRQNKKKIKRIIVPSSKEVRRGGKEISRNTFHPYAISKKCVELLAKTYSNIYNLDLQIIYFDNVYGEGDLNFNRLIPNFIKSLYSKKKFKLRNSSKDKRAYIYIDDLINALKFSVEHSNKCKKDKFIYINSKFKVSTKVLLGTISKITKDLESKNYMKNHKKLLIIKKNYKPNKWKQNYNLLEGLNNTIIWYKSFFLDKSKL